MRKLHTGFWAILATAVIYGSFGIMARFLNDGFGYYSQILVRASIALLIAGILVVLNKVSFKLSKSQLIKIIALGTAYFWGTTAFTIGSNMSKISVLLFMMYVGSFTTTLIASAVFFKEKLTFTKVIALVVVLTGLSLTFNFNFNDFSIGALLGVLCGVSDSVGNALRKSLGSVNRDLVLTIQFLIAIAWAGLLILLTQEIIIKEINAKVVIAAIAFGLALVLSGKLLLKGFKKIDFTVGQIVLSSEIFFATLLSFLFFLETPTGSELLGGILIFIGVSLVNFNLDPFWNKLLGKEKTSH